MRFPNSSWNHENARRPPRLDLPCQTAYQLRGRINTLASLADFESLDLIGPSLGCVTVAAACLGEFDCPLQDRE